MSLATFAWSLLSIVLLLATTVAPHSVQASTTSSWTTTTTTPAFIGTAAEKIRRDFLALTRRVTARHILLPKNDEVALALKQKIRNQAQDGLFVQDAFEQAAKRFSRDETTNYRGGLLGELVPQGYCQSPELDRYCFEVPLGQVVGPLESEFGYHLLLVSERTNCPKLDGANTKLVALDNDENGQGRLVPSEQVGQVDVGEMVLDQTTFFLGVFLGGGVLAEVVANLLDGSAN